ncbi:hypothetical protein E4U44_007969 [Claviceps purpurea]|nr:hypothetical protein E4U51_000290 [Claviceps purpurea]KAG6306545.1 hypothetical protein E4U44_007969 [Claviceps purpurea]
MDLSRILEYPDDLPGTAPAGHLTNATANCEQQDSSTAASQSSSTHSAEHSNDEGTIALSFDFVSGSHKTQLKRNDNAKSSARSRRKPKDTMRQLDEAKREIQRKDEEIQATRQTAAELLRKKDEEIEKRDEEIERLRQQREIFGFSPTPCRRFGVIISLQLSFV